MFTKEIEEALAEGRVDLAVHSLKDLPTELPEPFALAATPPRVDPRDVFVSVHAYESCRAAAGRAVGTSSQRRRAQLKALRPDIEAVEFRGNVDTRLRKLAEGQVEAILLAAAGLDRLGKTDWVRERLDPKNFCPAAGQGSLGIETRKGDAATIEAVAFLDHEPTRVCGDGGARGAGGAGRRMPGADWDSLPGGALRSRAAGAGQRTRSSPWWLRLRRAKRYAFITRRRAAAATPLRWEGWWRRCCWMPARDRCWRLKAERRSEFAAAGRPPRAGNARPHQAGKLSEGLSALGAEPVEVPVLEIRGARQFRSARQGTAAARQLRLADSHQRQYRARA